MLSILSIHILKVSLAIIDKRDSLKKKEMGHRCMVSILRYTSTIHQRYTAQRRRINTEEQEKVVAAA